MKTSEEEVYELFSNVKNEYGKYHKCIFHIHTPASYDYKLYENSSKKYEIMTDEEMYELAIEEKIIANKSQIKHLELDTSVYSSMKEYITYLIIANKLIENYIETVVIADHNTFSGITKLEQAIKVMSTKNKKCYPQVISGAEITCADKTHVVIMFEKSKIKEIKEYITNILIDEESGTYVTGLEIIQKISEFGGFSYIAHINSSDITKSGILTGGYKKRLFEQDELKILGVSKLSQIDTVTIDLRNYTAKKFEYILDNDSHGIDTLLDSYFWLKGTRTDFSIIKDLYKDYDVTVSLEEPKESENYIKGLVVENSDESFLMPKNKEDKYLIIPFSQSLNCIIGGRGTGKSTILNLIEFMLSQYVHRKEDLEMICRNSRVWLLYKLDKKEYLIKFSPPVKEYSEENILKYFSERVPGYREYSMRYFFDSEKIKYIALREYIEIYKVGKNSKSIYFEKIQRKYSVLKHLFKTSYSINKLVSISFEDEKLSDFIVDTVFQDKQIVKCKNVKKATTIEELKDNLKKVKQTIKKHEEEIKNIIEIYNEHNKNSLKITYIKNFDIEPEEIIYIRKSKRGFVIIGDKEFNVYVDSIYKILYEIIQEKGTFEILDLYINDKLANVLKEYGLKNLKENISVREIEQDVIMLKKQDDDKFIDKLLETSKMNIVEDMNELFRRILFKLDSFTLEFNVNSNMPKTQRIFRNIKELSLGQKVVALLSFILSYSEIANDHTPLVIDQPEDNLDSQYIYNNLVNQFRSVKEKRQIIIATHNSTIVVNSKTENVIVMNSDNNKGWVEESGYPTDKKIVNSILRYLEGGKESFKHKELIYKDYLNN